MEFDILISSITKNILLTADELLFFKGLIKSKSLKKGEFLIREGQICKYETFVTKGCLKSFYLDENGFEHIMDFSVENWWAEDLFSFFTQTASKSNIQAIEETHIIQISKTDLETLYSKIPKFERFFRLSFQNAYITQRERINLTLSATAEERYFLFIKKYPYAEKRFSQKDIASYLGITRQFLSVLKKNKNR